MATLQFEDDCDIMKVDICEFDSSWKWQANELRAIGAVAVFYSQIPLVTQIPAGSLPPKFGKVCKVPVLSPRHERGCHPFAQVNNEYQFSSILVGTRFGESTMKLSSMLTDGQVGRFKDKSAAAMSTFGDMLPVQAAGILSSLTAARSDL
ncbi:hypothetical protein GIB67_010081 [Kingdonia uniflora]|uniref:Uncharacterized protein n=1 Tax=Kingdonia uniflora TaxID=39325 RepID=A0A7J7PBC7_9MAGN|nr:hypothetical protein GIB67_010081 [Kingdonia uniflora]